MPGLSRRPPPATLHTSQSAGPTCMITGTKYFSWLQFRTCYNTMPSNAHSNRPYPQKSDGTGQVELKLPDRRQNDRSARGETTSSKVGGEWKAAYDQSRFRTYYYHTITKEVRWEADPASIAETSTNNNNHQSNPVPFASPKVQTKIAAAPSSASSGLKQRRTPRQKQQQHASQSSTFSPRTTNIQDQVESALAQVLPNDTDGRTMLMSKYAGREDDLLQAVEELRSEGQSNNCSVNDVTDKMMRIKSRTSTGAVNKNNNNGSRSSGGGALIFSPYRQPNGKAGTPTPRKRTSPTILKAKLNSPSIGISRTFTANSEDSLERGSPYKFNTTNSPRRSYGSSSRRRERTAVWSVLALVVVLVCAIAVTMRSRSSSSDGDVNGRSFHVNSVTAADKYGFVATTSDPTAAPTATPTISPTPGPSPSPTFAPTQSPSQSPTGPTQSPTPRPTYLETCKQSSRFAGMPS